MTPISTISAPLHQFLQWVAERPRTYADVMDEWRSSCPRLTVWEDASIDGLVALQGGPTGLVVLTSAGQAALDQAVRSSPTPNAAWAAANLATGTR